MICYASNQPSVGHRIDSIRRLCISSASFIPSYRGDGVINFDKWTFLFLFSLSARRSRIYCSLNRLSFLQKYQPITDNTVRDWAADRQQGGQHHSLGGALPCLFSLSSLRPRNCFFNQLLNRTATLRSLYDEPQGVSWGQPSLFWVSITDRIMS